MELKHKYEIGVGLLFLIGLLTLGYMAVRIGGAHRFGPQKEYFVEIADATGLVKNGAVLVAGVEVGYIKSVEVDSSNNQARAAILVGGDLTLKQDARAIIRAKSLLGEKFLDLFPGSPESPELPDGSMIRHSSSLISMDQFVEEIRSDFLGKVNPELVNGLLEVTYNSLKGREQDIGDTIHSVRNIIVKFDEELNQPDGSINRTLTGVGALAATLGSLTKEEKSELIDAARNVNRLLDWMVITTPRIDENFDRLDRLADAGLLSEHRAAGFMNEAELLMTQANDLLGRFSMVDFEDIKRMLQDEGVTISLSSRSDELREEDLKRFDIKRETEEKADPEADDLTGELPKVEELRADNK